MKKVIDADNMKILEYFNEKDTDAMLKRYENMGLWNAVSVDQAGDIILWED